MVEQEEKTLQEYIGVSEYAAFIGRTTMAVYGLIKDGIVSAVKFQRGSMNGWLIPKPDGYDEWKSKQQ